MKKIMTIEVIIESIKDNEAILITTAGEHIRLPFSLLPMNCLVGQKLWVSLSDTEPIAAVVTPQAILNELLRSNESKKTT